MYRILFISPRKSAGAFARPKGMTFQWKTGPLGVTKGEQFLGCSGEVYLPKATSLLHLGFQLALGGPLQGVVHVRYTS